MLNKTFLRDAAERATKTALQSALATFGVDQAGVAELGLGPTLVAAALGFGASVLTSLASRARGDKNTASALK